MLSLLIHFADQEQTTSLSNISEPLVPANRLCALVWKSLLPAMAPCRKLLYFVFVFFFMLAQRPSGKWEQVGF